MMRSHAARISIAVLAGLLVLPALAAERFEDAALKLSLNAPEAFVPLPGAARTDEFIGEIKRVYLAPDVVATGGALVIHHKSLPAGWDFDKFKGLFAVQIASAYGDKFRLLRQQDIEAAGRPGFMVEFTCTGDGTKPDPAGTLPHHLRWHFLKDGDDKTIGALYSSQESAWKGLEPRMAASFQSVKATE